MLPFPDANDGAMLSIVSESRKSEPMSARVTVAVLTVASLLVALAVWLLVERAGVLGV